MKSEDDQEKVGSLLSKLRILTKDINKLADEFEGQADQMEARTKKEKVRALLKLVENENDRVFETVCQLLDARIKKRLLED